MLPPLDLSALFLHSAVLSFVFCRHLKRENFENSQPNTLTADLHEIIDLIL